MKKASIAASIFLISTLLVSVVPSWSQNVGTKWDVLETSGPDIARSPIAMTYELDGAGKALKGPVSGSIYVIGPTSKYNYCSVALLIGDDDKEAYVSRRQPISAQWRSTKKAAQKTSQHRLLSTSKKPMLKDPAQFIERLKASQEVVLTFPLGIGNKQTHVRFSLKGSTKTINRACQIP